MIIAIFYTILVGAALFTAWFCISCMMIDNRRQ